MNAYAALQHLCDKYSSNNELNSLNKKLSTLTNKPNIAELINTYNSAIPIIEEEMWEKGITDTTLEIYQTLFHELENLHASHSKTDNRHCFIITIPIADRPQHLKECLNSIFTLCEKFNYGGMHHGVFNKIRVLIADDSKEIENIKKHIGTSEYYTKKGLEVIYFSQKQQHQVTTAFKQHKIKKITGDFDASHFHHKGASITRNICYLKLQQLQKKGEKTLFYFIDSDQEFQINMKTRGEYKEKYAVNYFYYLDHIFSTQSVSILTGKVVGDPPVSPAVMAGTFLQDITGFLQQLSTTDAESTCIFHNEIQQQSNNASYHDMPELFGFKKNKKFYHYPCPIKEPHTNAHSLEYFSKQINHFFDGVHPTRKSYFQHENVLDSIKPARTIYTGNYIFKPENLKYFIPFAPLKLRMAGPVLGRILQSEIGNAFVCANLPMLHKRTVDATGQSEFRPGVDHNKKNIDLSGEFHRQFFGDVMLFSLIKLCELGYPKKDLTIHKISSVVKSTSNEIQKKYLHTQESIERKLTQLKQQLNSKEINTFFDKHKNQSKQNFLLFISNIEFNFKNNAKIYAEIKTNETLYKNTEEIIHAIFSYKMQRANWEQTLAEGNINQ